jgi:tetratricopeptide (TPR) repeat protein
MNLQPIIIESLKSFIGFATDNAVVLGSLAAIVALAAYTLKPIGFLLKFLKKKEKPQAASSQVIAVETINNGLTGQDLDTFLNFVEKSLHGEELQSDTGKLADVAKKLGVAESLIAEHLRKFGKLNVPPDQWGERLDQVAKSFKEGKLAVDLLHPDETKQQAVLEQARDAIQLGDIDGSLKHLLELEQSERAALIKLGTSTTKHQTNLYQALSARGALFSAKGLHSRAAEIYESAAKECEKVNEKAYIQFLLQSANAYETTGSQSGKLADYKKSQTIYEHLLGRIDLDPDKLPVAAIQNNLGVVLTSLGERQEGPESYNKAKSAHIAALEFYTFETFPVEWARTQNNLGNALTGLGEREAGSRSLFEAQGAYEQALRVRTKDSFPNEWATTQNNLGTLLSHVGDREEDPERYRNSRRAYELALEVRSKDRLPIQWATTMMNLGTALSSLGEYEEGTESYLDAMVAYDHALEVLSKAWFPFHWAMLMNNKGIALTRLGEHEESPEWFVKATLAFQQSLEIYIEGVFPIQWAMAQNNLGLALEHIGKYEKGTESLHQATDAYRNSLMVYSEKSSHFQWKMVSDNLTRVQQTIASRQTENDI